MGIWLGPRGKSVITENDFSYSGNYLFASDGEHWELVLLDGNAASLVFTKSPGRVDLFVVGGGQSGQSGSGNAQYGAAYGGQGGYGGECINADGILMQSGVNYSATIGGSDESSSLIGGNLNYLARSGYGSPGGRGGCAAQGGEYDADAGTDGVFAYNKNSDTLMTTAFQGHKFGPGGGGGGATLSVIVEGWKANGALGGASNGSGNAYGAGAKSSVNSGSSGSSGYANHGQGGGGPETRWNGQYTVSYSGGLGGSGIIFLRDAR